MAGHPYMLVATPADYRAFVPDSPPSSFVAKRRITLRQSAVPRFLLVMPALVAGIHVLLAPKTWMAGTSPAMTVVG